MAFVAVASAGVVCCDTWVRWRQRACERCRSAALRRDMAFRLSGRLRYQGVRGVGRWYRSEAFDQPSWFLTISKAERFFRLACAHHHKQSANSPFVSPERPNPRVSQASSSPCDGALCSSPTAAAVAWAAGRGNRGDGFARRAHLTLCLAQYQRGFQRRTWATAIDRDTTARLSFSKREARAPQRRKCQKPP